MMDAPLTTRNMFQHGLDLFGKKEIVSRTSTGDYVRLDVGEAESGWPAVDENLRAATCYTAATAGNPKGVVYTHRSTYLHTMAHGLNDVLGVSERDVILPFVPMFHVNAWGLPYSG